MIPVSSEHKFCLLLQVFMNNKKNSYIPALYYNNKFIADFKEKDELFNQFFIEWHTLVNSTSKLLTDSSRKKKNSLSTISFGKIDSAKIIKIRDLSKVKA